MNKTKLKRIIKEELQAALNDQPRGVSDLLKSANMIRWHLGAIAGDAENLGKLARWQKSIDEMLTAQDFEKADEALTSYIEKLGGFVQELSTAHKELQLLKDSLK